MPAKSKRLRVDLYPPVSTKLKAKAKEDRRTVSNMASLLLDKAIPSTDARPTQQQAD